MIQRQIGSDRFKIVFRRKDGTLAEKKLIDLVATMIDERLTGIDTRKFSKDDIHTYVNHVTKVIAGRFDLKTDLMNENS